MNRNRIIKFGATLLATITLVSGCEQARENTQATNNAQTAALPADLFLDNAPRDARGVADVKADTDGPTNVVVHGRIGGRPKPFVDGAAVFLLADASMKTCDELHGDGCPTPWDYCCEPRESLSAKTATVQIVDADGRPLPINVKGQHGLDPSAHVTIVGTVAERSDGKTLVINARNIFVGEPTG